MFENRDDISNSGFFQENEYRISDDFTGHSEIAARGYCRLFKAQRQGQWFVLKNLKTEYTADPVFQGLFAKEYGLMMQLNHPNIARIYGMEQDAVAGKCIVMEYVDGRTLEAFVAENPSQSVRKVVAQQLLDALGYCHGKQIIHRDLKPSNVLVTYNGNAVKLIDFGLSDSDSYAVLKGRAYTEAYAAPEQLEGADVDCRTDLYAFGLLLRTLFPNRYGRVARKCLQPRKEKRYSSTAEVAEAMRMSDLRRKRIPWFAAGMLAIIALLATFPFLGKFLDGTGQTRTETPPTADTVYQVLTYKDTRPESQITSETRALNHPISIITGKADTAAITARQQRADSILNARKQEEVLAQEALDNAIYHFKFTIDSMFKPVDQYLKSEDVKTSNILRDLLSIAEYKARIRECQVRGQLPKSKRNSFYYYANDRIKAKKKTYTQDYPAIPFSTNEQQVSDPVYRPIWEQSMQYQEEKRQLRDEWERMMQAVSAGKDVTPK